MTFAHLLLAVTEPTAAENLSVFAPASPPAESIRGLFYLVLAVTGAIFLLVEGTLLYCILRFRRRSAADTTEPPQIYGSRPIEVAWTVAPLLIVFVLFLVVSRIIADVRHVPQAEANVRVTVVGHQWWWEYRYQPGDDVVVTTANELHVPEGQVVELDLQSIDVVHSYWVPRLAGKTDVIPGRTNRMWFRALQPGLYLGQCAEYCGTQHANMLLRVVAEPHDQFVDWLHNERQPAREDPRAEAGRRLFFATACVNCHTVTRARPRPSATGKFGPDLTHLMSRKTLASGMVENNRENLRRWVRDPQEIKPGCLMPSMHLSENDVETMVDYLLTLR